MPLKMSWDVIMAILIMYSVLIIPYRISLDDQEDASSLAFDVFVDVMFGLDILISFRTAFFLDDGKVLIVDPLLIAKDYCRGWFLIDLISTIPIDRFVALAVTSVDSSNNLRTLKLVRSFRIIRLFKILRILKFSKISENVKDFLDFSPASFRLLQLTSQVLFMAHFMGCFFYLISSNHEDTDTWWNAAGLADNSKFEIYIAAIYWAISTMTTVGYGDILPRNESEMIFCIFCGIIGATMFGFVVGNISNMVGNFNAGLRKEKEQMQRVRNYLREQWTSKRLAKQVISYYENWLQYKTAFAEDALLEQMPRNLKIDIMYFIYRDVIPKVSIFGGQSRDYVATLLRLLRPEHHSTGSVVYHEGDGAFEMYFVTSGSFRSGYYLGNHDSEVCLRQHYTGTCFGDSDVILRRRRPVTVMANERSHVLSLSREKINWLLRRYPPWAKILTSKMQELWAEELKYRHWKTLKRRLFTRNLALRMSVANPDSSFQVAKTEEEQKAEAKDSDASEAAEVSTDDGRDAAGVEKLQSPLRSAYVLQV